MMYLLFLLLIVQLQHNTNKSVHTLIELRDALFHFLFITITEPPSQRENELELIVAMSQNYN